VWRRQRFLTCFARVKCTHTINATNTGVKVTPEDVRERILSGLGSDDGYMDMMQLVSLLLIPVLREEQERRQQDVRMENGDADLLEYTLEMMLHDVTGSRMPKRLTRTLIKQILQAYGETALSEDDDLVQQMLEHAGASSSQDGVLLDVKAFCRALTSDVQEFDVENKDKLSTNFDDVMFSTNRSDQVHAEPEQTHATMLQRTQSQTPTVFNKTVTVDDVPLMYTAPQVDNAADTFRSKPLTVLMWTFFVLSFQTYLFKYLSSNFMGLKCPPYQFSKWAENVASFFCQVGVSILRWIVVMLVMSVVGSAYFWLAGIGNFIECKKPIFPLIGMVFALLSTLLPWWFIGRVTPRDDGTAEEFLEVAQEFLEIITFVLGGCTILLSIWQFISILLPETGWLWQRYRWILVAEAIRTESRVKKASAHKINMIVTNALEVHRVKKQETVVPTHFGQALLNFAEMAPEYARIGGCRWTWSMICSRNLFRREGLFFSARLLSSNFTQFALTPFIFIGGIMITWVLTTEFADRVNAYEELLMDEFHIELDLTGRSASTQKAMTAALAAGTSIAFVTALSIAVMVLPSATTTALKFRSGVIPFANDTRVKMLRIAPDQTAYLKGLMFWGTLFASVLMGIIVGKSSSFPIRKSIM